MIETVHLNLYSLSLLWTRCSRKLKATWIIPSLCSYLVLFLAQKTMNIIIVLILWRHPRCWFRWAHFCFAYLFWNCPCCFIIYIFFFQKSSFILTIIDVLTYFKEILDDLVFFGTVIYFYALKSRYVILFSTLSLIDSFYAWFFVFNWLHLHVNCGWHLVLEFERSHSIKRTMSSVLCLFAADLNGIVFIYCFKLKLFKLKLIVWIH